MRTESEYSDLSLDECVSKFYDIYKDATRPRTLMDLCIKIVRDVAKTYAVTRRLELQRLSQRLAEVFSDLCIIVAKCQDRSPLNRAPKALYLDKKYSEYVWSRYPTVCPYCACLPCACTQIRVEMQQEKTVDMNTVLETFRQKARLPRTLSDWVKLANSLYGHTYFTLPITDLAGRLIEETIELLSIVSQASKSVKEDQKAQVLSDFGDELADVFMWICAMGVKLSGFSSTHNFPVVVKDTLRNSKKKLGRIEALHRADLKATSKGRLLEEVADEIFAMVPDFEVRKNKRTSTGEIDRIIRNKSNHPFIRSLGTHILIECKSSKYPVSKKEIVDFIDKIISHRCKCGVLVSLSGVSGKRNRDALAKIKEAFDRVGVILMTFNLQDLKRIQMGEDPTAIFYEKYESVKFM